MYRFNGGIFGYKVQNIETEPGYIKSAILPRGRHNGGYIGAGERLSDNLDDNVDKTSGIWHLSTGLKFVENHAITTEVDNSYYESQPPQQAFQETSRTFLGGGYTWNPYSACPSVMWPQGSMGGHSGAGYAGGTQRDWTSFGSSATCTYWSFDVYGINGYYYTYYPPPVYVEQIDIVTNYYDVWDYF